MADKKISALTAASTPLAGSEVLPIVQSSATVKVSVDNLWAGRVVTSDGFRNQRPGVATQYIEQVAAGGGTFLNIVNNANSANMSYQVVRTTTAGTTYPLLLDSNDNYQIQLGNVVFGTAAKGVNFTANTPAAGMTSQLLNWYEEGTFTPSFSFTSGSVTYSAQNGVYTRVGNVVTLNFWIAINTVSTPAGTLKVSGLPFAAKNVRYRPSPSLRSYDLTGVTGVIGGYVDLGESDIRINTYNNGTSSTTDASVLANGCEIGGTLVYIV